MRRGQKWTKEMDAELRQHLDARLSCAQIATMMGRGLSRNAVIGRLHRLGWTGQTYVRVARPKKEKKPKVNTPIIRFVPMNGNSSYLRMVQSVESELGELRCVEIEPRNISLSDLEPNDCRYPYGDSPFLFCGHPAMIGRSYCAPHLGLTTTLPRVRLSREELLENRRQYTAAWRAQKRARVAV